MAGKTAKKQQKKNLKVCKNPECKVELIRLTIFNSPAYKEAFYKIYGIRDCIVRILRLTKKEISKPAPKLYLKPSGNVRLNSHISWFPAPSTVLKNSVDVLSSLTDYQNKNGIAPTVAGKGKSEAKSKPSEVATKRQRAKSMFAERIDDTNDAGKNAQTMDDIYLNLNMKSNSNNRELKPGSERQLSEMQPKPTPKYQSIFEEIKAKLEEKRSKQLEIM